MRVYTNMTIEKMQDRANTMWAISVFKFIEAVKEKPGIIQDALIATSLNYVNLALREEDEIGFILRKEWL